MLNYGKPITPENVTLKSLILPVIANVLQDVCFRNGSVREFTAVQIITSTFFYLWIVV